MEEGGQEVLVNGENGKGNLADEVLEDLEEYWENINDRLVISRMVSDSVVRGMVTAIEQEAAEKIASREIEVTSLKEFLQSPESQNTREELHALRNLAIEQLIDVKKGIEFVKTESNSEWGSLGAILPEKRCGCIDRMMESLEKTMGIVCTKVDDVLFSSKVSLCELQEERDLEAKLEGMVIKSVIRGVREEFGDNFWERIQSVNWIEKFEGLSNLGSQLDTIFKSLSIHDPGLLSHGSHDLDSLHHKKSLFGENGELDASSIHEVKAYGYQQLKHLSKDELVYYFNDIITTMKREHEKALHQKTEEYFRLKREYLRERGSFVTHRKDEEFNVLRKKIPEVISKLEDFLLQNERFPALVYTAESFGNMKHRLEGLLSENQQLRDSLDDKKNEVKRLEVEALRHCSSEETMLNLVENLNAAVEDMRMEASLKEDVYKCALREQIAQTWCDYEDSDMEVLITQEIYDIILREAHIPPEIADKYENEDSDIKSLITEGFLGLMYAEVIKDAEEKFKDLSREVLRNKESITHLEAKAIEKESELRQVVEDREKLKQKIVDLGTVVTQKEQLAEELESLKYEHLIALEQIQIDKNESHRLNQMLDHVKGLLTEAEKQRSIALRQNQEMQEKLLSVGAVEGNLKKEVEMALGGLSKIFDDFECRVLGAIKKNSVRLEDTRCHLKALNRTAYALRTTGLMYKQKLDRRFSDLQMAEAEVDLLGDEVDSLLRLLEKIFIALDHYSPVLKHYPGIIEILKLVRRELTGQATKDRDRSIQWQH